jgi:hypothetical protein
MWNEASGNTVLPKMKSFFNSQTFYCPPCPINKRETRGKEGKGWGRRDGKTTPGESVKALIQITFEKWGERRGEKCCDSVFPRKKMPQSCFNK